MTAPWDSAVPVHEELVVRYSVESNDVGLFPWIGKKVWSGC